MLDLQPLVETNFKDEAHTTITFENADNAIIINGYKTPIYDNTEEWVTEADIVLLSPEGLIIAQMKAVEWFGYTYNKSY